MTVLALKPGLPDTFYHTLKGGGGKHANMKFQDIALENSNCPLLRRMHLGVLFLNCKLSESEMISNQG